LITLYICTVNLPDAVTLGGAYNGGGDRVTLIVAAGGRLAAAVA